MSKYILYSKLWSSLENRYGESFDGIPHDFDGPLAKDEAHSIIGRFCRRYKFIDDAIRQQLGTASTSTGVYFFVTICPPDSPDMLSRLKRVVERLLKRKNIERYIMAYEQRTEAFEPLLPLKGVHAHILLKSRSSYDTISRSVKNLVGEWIYKVDCKKEAWVGDKVQYLLGHKDAAKEAMCNADRDFRSHYKLDNIYYTGKWPTLPDRRAEGDVPPPPSVTGGPHGLGGVSPGGRTEDGRLMSPIPENSQIIPDISPILTAAANFVVPYAPGYNNSWEATS